MHVRLTTMILAVLASACGTSTFNNLRLADAQDRALKERTPAEAAKAVVYEGEVSWIVLRRVCLTDVGGWFGKRDLTVGITVTMGAAGAAQVGKGVVTTKGVGDYECLQFAERQVIDPFVFRRTTYRIAFDVVKLPSENAKLLASMANMVVGNAILSPQLAPAAKIGTALFDTFVKPQIEKEKTLAHFEQDFEAFEITNSVVNPQQPWQRGTFVLLPRDGVKYDVNGEKKEFRLDLAKLYLDTNGFLREGIAAQPASLDQYFDSAPYLVVEFKSHSRGAGEADQAVSAALLNAAMSVRQVTPGNRTPGEGPMQEFTATLGQNVSGLTPWARLMFQDAFAALSASLDGLAANEGDAERNRALRLGASKLDGVLTRYYTNSPPVRLTKAESDSLAAVKEAIAGALAPLAASAKAQGDAARSEIERARDGLVRAFEMARRGLPGGEFAAFADRYAQGFATDISSAAARLREAQELAAPLP